MGRHADCIHRLHAQFNRAAHTVVDVTLSTNILNMLVIRAERPCRGVDSFRHQTAHQCVQIARRTALTNMNVHSQPALLLRLGIGGALVVGAHTGGKIGAQLLFIRCHDVAVANLVGKQL